MNKKEQNKEIPPFLSILIPTWNRVDEVIRAVESVGASFEDIEVIVVDNASDYKISDRLKTLFSDKDHVKFFRNEKNIGMVKNWNECISYAKGEWMGLLCSDDEFSSGAVDYIRGILHSIKSPALVLQDPGIADPYIVCNSGAKTVRGIRLPLASGNFWHRLVPERIGPFDERLEYSPDAEYWYRAASQFPVIKVKKPLAIYHAHDTNYMWETWAKDDFLDQTSLLIRLNCRHSLGDRYNNENVNKEVNIGLKKTVFTILETTVLMSNKKNIFDRYCDIAQGMMQTGDEIERLSRIISKHHAFLNITAKTNKQTAKCANSDTDIPITFMAAVYNEESRIRYVLEHAARWADEIVIINKSSTDRTKAICEEFGQQVRIVDVPFSPKGHGDVITEARFPKNDWIFCGTASEIPTYNLIQSAKNILSETKGRLDLIYVPRKYYSLGIHDMRSPWSVSYFPFLINRKQAIISNAIHAGYRPGNPQNTRMIPFSDDCCVYHLTHLSAKDYMLDMTQYFEAEAISCTDPDKKILECFNNIAQYEKQLIKAGTPLLGHYLAWHIYWLGTALFVWEKQRGLNVREYYTNIQEKVIREEWLFPRAQYEDARKLLDQKNYAAAIEALEKILLENPDLGIIHNDLGVLYARLGNNEKTLAHYEAAVRSKPDNATFAKNLADFYYAVQKNTERALQMYIKCLSVNPDDIEILMTIGHISIEIGRPESAKDFYDKVLTIDPQNKDAQKIIDLLNNRNQGIPARQEPSTANDPVDPSTGYLVSAVVSVYNSERFIRGCIEDLENQTIADKLEIIIVDSCSPQNERAVIEEMQRQYDNIKYIRTEKRETVYEAWNRGIRASSGKYITNANTDDRHRKDALEKMLNCLENNPDKVLAYADSLVTKIENELFDFCTVSDRLQWPDFNKEMLLNYCFIGPQPMWRKNLHEEIGFFDEKYETAADYEFWLRAARKYDFIHIKEFLGLYWLNENTVSRKGERPLVEAKEIQQKYRRIFYLDNFKDKQNNNAKRTILFVLHSSPQYRYGGTEYYSFNLIKELTRLGNDVRFLYPVYNRQQPAPTLVENEFNGIKAYEIHSNQSNQLNIELNSHTYVQLFKKVLLTTRFDVVHFHHTLGLPYLFLRIVRDYGIKSCLTLHDFWLMCLNVHLIRPDSTDICDGPRSAAMCTDCILQGQADNKHLRSQFHSVLEKRKAELTILLNEVDILSAPSRYVANKFKQYFKLDREITVSGLGLIHTKEPPQKNINSTVRFGYFGGIAKIKNVNFLADAFKLTKGNATLGIWGNGAADDIQKLRDNIKSDNRIRYYGGYLPDQLDEIMKSVDVFCNPSLMESYSFTVREALNRNVPVVSSNRGALPEIITDRQNGLLFDPINAAQLSDIMQSLIDNRQLLEHLKSNIVPVLSIEDDARSWDMRYQNMTNADAATGTNAANEEGPVTLTDTGKTDGLYFISELSQEQTAVQTSAPFQPNTVSIVILTFNELKYTRECVQSIMKYTPNPHEIIFVDNGSTDDTLKWLKRLNKENPRYRFIRNKKNLGFAKGCNQGIKTASGEYILLLNNDVVVTENWLSGMLECLNSSPRTGIVGPMTNNISGPQKVPDADYKSMNLMHDYSKLFREKYRHRRIFSSRVVGFCMLFRRSLVDRVGLLDESFGTGNFEDDDFCLRATLADYDNYIAGDVFIHHYGSRSFVGNKIDYSSSISGNKQIFDAKWTGLYLNTSLGRKLAAHNAIIKAETLYQRGKRNQAINTLVEGLKQVPEEKVLYYRIAELMLDAEFYKEALKAVKPIVTAAENDPRCLEILARAKAGLGEDGGCYIDRMLEIDGAYAPALNLRAAYKQENREVAENLLRQAIEAAPGYGKSYTNLGILKWASGQKDEALDYLEKGFILSPTLTDCLTHYHLAITELQQFAGAEKIVHNTKALHPDSRKITFLFIDILIKQDKYDKAMEEIEKAMVEFGIDDGMLAAALEIRNRVGTKEIDKEAGNKNTLSLCMIVKNEERHLARCLLNVQPAVDEIIIADTGSTDSTKNIALAFGAKVFDFPWTNDFSAARNQSLAKASGDWILVLDADEVISPLDHTALKQLIRKNSAKPAAYSMVTRNYTDEVSVKGWTANNRRYPQEEAGTGWFPSTKVRLFPNGKHIRFDNPVHEFVETSVEKAGIVIKTSDIPVHHYGRFDKDKLIAKGREYFLLGKQKIDEMGKNPKALTELAIQASELGEYETAVNLWKKVVEHDGNNSVAFLNISYAYMKLGKYAEALASSRRAMELDPEMKEASLNYAGTELVIGDINKTISVLETLLQKNPDYPPAMALLALACHVNGREQKGLDIFEKLRKMGFNCTQFLMEEYRILISQGKIDQAISVLEAAVKTGNINQDTNRLLAECQDKKRSPAVLD